MKQIWVIESGDYSQRGVDGVAASPELAVALLKEQHETFRRAHPEYAGKNGWDVEWGPLTHEVCERADMVGWDYWQIIATYQHSTTEYQINLYDFKD